MPAIRWRSKQDFEAGQFDGTEVTADGRIVLSEGETDGTWTSQIAHAEDFLAWSALDVLAVQPEGSVVAVRFRVGPTEAECEAEDWSEWYDLADASGRIAVGLWLYFNNPGAAMTEGPFIQIQLRLMRA